MPSRQAAISRVLRYDEHGFTVSRHAGGRIKVTTDGIPGMSDLPVELKYAKSHEWVRQESDGVLSVGITDHAQEELGDLVYIEMPEIGKHLKAGEQCAVVESVKAASDLYCPVSGEIVEINTAVVNEPESVNDDAYSAWLFSIRPDSVDDLADLLDAEGYREFIDA